METLEGVAGLCSFAFSWHWSRLRSSACSRSNP